MARATPDRPSEIARDTAFQFYTGFRQPDYWTKDAGIYNIHDAVEFNDYDSRTFRMTIRPWDSDAIKSDVARIIARGYKKIKVAGYSWGCGLAIPEFAAELAKYDRNIDRLVLIDPVIYAVGKWFSQAMLVGTSPYILPPNVVEAAVCRTTNYINFWNSPWGRGIQSSPGCHTKIISQIMYGSQANLTRFDPGHECAWIQDPNIDHFSIDDDLRTQDWAVQTLLQESA